MVMFMVGGYRFLLPCCCGADILLCSDSCPAQEGLAQLCNAPEEHLGLEGQFLDSV